MQLPEVIYTCPICGGDIRLSDTWIGMNETPTQDWNYMIRVETKMYHVGTVSEDCGKFFLAFAEEQKDILKRKLDAGQELWEERTKLSPSQIEWVRRASQKKHG